MSLMRTDDINRSLGALIPSWFSELGFTKNQGERRRWKKEEDGERTFRGNLWDDPTLPFLLLKYV